mmetsp:Transcript_107752/g.303593  ORF Transcript_107752/g.303593 Transcript_107752/m.303593 type:complete len:222 (+) Transcript_107752:539-1204(+)
MPPMSLVPSRDLGLVVEERTCPQSDELLPVSSHLAAFAHLGAKHVGEVFLLASPVEIVRVLVFDPVARRLHDRRGGHRVVRGRLQVLVESLLGRILVIPGAVWPAPGARFSSPRMVVGVKGGVLCQDVCVVRKQILARRGRRRLHHPLLPEDLRRQLLHLLLLRAEGRPTRALLPVDFASRVVPLKIDRSGPKFLRDVGVAALVGGRAHHFHGIAIGDQRV